MADNPYMPPPGQMVCWDCLGVGTEPNVYNHSCDSPGCQDPLTVDCFACDGVGHRPDER
ncbi:hypothetical protein [Streptomyces sp. NPDC001594]|uniref:hypothetical protein n=1 Tax=Streptomyces sp. NPDC001594 TaxID=3364590 RepID=UPI0036C729FE